MPIKILLADKSITIQKVVEMLFSGRDYEVVCVSDGEAALTEAARAIPDVVLADVDLPRVDGYGLAAGLRHIPQLEQTPVILMMSRDDVYDSAKGKQAGIIDSIAKPFESQELIGKVKKALAAASTRPAGTIPPSAAAAFAADRPKRSTPPDIFDIIQEAPTDAEVGKAAASAEEEVVYEVEPEVEEIEEPLARETEKALPVGDKAVEEIRTGLGLSEKIEATPVEIIPFESLDMALEAGPMAAAPPPKPSAAVFAVRPPSMERSGPRTPMQALPESELRTMVDDAVSRMAKEALAKMAPPQPPTISASDLWNMTEETVTKMAKDLFAQMQPVQPPQISEGALRDMVEEKVSALAQEAIGKISLPAPPALSEEELRTMANRTITTMAEEMFKDMPPPLPKISDETVRRGIEETIWKVAHEAAKEVIEQVAWEVVPRLAEHLIKKEIERLKALQ